jgi:glycosyltransferase involved in cell wall biosynthesis
LKKVLFIIESLSVGGAEKVLIDLVNNLDKDKYQITVIAIYNKSVRKSYQRQFENLFEDHIKYRFLCDITDEDKYKMFNRLLHRLPISLFYRLYIHEKYDIEVAFSEGLPTKIICGSNNKKSLKYAWLHTDTRNFIKGMIKKQIYIFKNRYLKYDRIIAVSNSVAKSFEKEMDIRKTVEVKYNPIDEKAIILKAQEPCQIIKKSEVFTIVSVGRLVEVKGYDRLIEIARKLKLDELTFKILVIGDGEQRCKLEQLITEKGVGDCVELMGFHANPYKYMRQADLLICSSRAEGLSTVVTEAIILGKPVLTTDCAGMQELLGENEYGIITENSEVGLYKDLKDLILDKERYNHYKNQAAIRSNYFKMDRLIAAVEEIF